MKRKELKKVENGESVSTNRFLSNTERERKKKANIEKNKK